MSISFLIFGKFGPLFLQVSSQPLSLSFLLDSLICMLVILIVSHKYLMFSLLFFILFFFLLLWLNDLKWLVFKFTDSSALWSQRLSSLNDVFSTITVFLISTFSVWLFFTLYISLLIFLVYSFSWFHLVCALFYPIEHLHDGYFNFFVRQLVDLFCLCRSQFLGFYFCSLIGPCFLFAL